MPFNLIHRYTKMSEVGEVYLSSTVFHFVNSLTGIFIPLYLINVLDFSLSLVLVLLVVLNAIRSALAYPMALLISHIGSKHGMIAAFPISILMYLFLYLLPGNEWLIWLVTLLQAVVASIYAQSFDIDLSKGSHEDKRGAELAKTALFQLVGLAIGPLIGGFIIQRYGFSGILIFSMATLGFASLPLLLTPEIYHKRRFTLNILDLKAVFKDSLSSLFYHIEQVSAVTIWAIFVYFILENYEAVGGARTVLLLTGAISTYFVGKVIDKYDRKKILGIGAILNSTVEFVRVFARTVPAVFISDFLRGLVIPFRILPWTAIFYKHADEQPRQEYIFINELAASLGLMFLTLIMLVVNIIWGDMPSLITGLAIGALAGLGVRFTR